MPSSVACINESSGATAWRGKKIVNINFADVVNPGLTRDEVIEVGNGLYMYGQGFKAGNNVTALAAPGAWHGEQHTNDFLLFDQAFEFIARINLSVR